MPEYRVPLVSEIKVKLARDGYKFEFVSLFAGGGGSSTGYRMAGGKGLAMNEFIEVARQTYAANWPDTYIFPQDVRELTGDEILEKIGKKKGELDLLDGSPPCSGFSSSGKVDKLWGKTKAYSDGKQNSVETLFYDYLRILNDIQPKVCVAENVAGLVKGKSKGYFNEFLREFEKVGYKTAVKLLDARWLGVPQTRARVIFVGVRKDLWRDEFTGKTHPAPFKQIVKLKDAFKGLTFTEQDRKETDISGLVVYKRLCQLRPGETHSKRFTLSKASPEYCSPCITASNGNVGMGNACHWENRTFTVAEVKRIMSVPDDYILLGDYKQKVERLGRMVPPLMMREIAMNLYQNILSKIQ